jgi:hypothetical protein
MTAVLDQEIFCGSMQKGKLSQSKRFPSRKAHGFVSKQRRRSESGGNFFVNETTNLSNSLAPLDGGLGHDTIMPGQAHRS